MSLNHVTLTGNLTRDPETRNIPNSDSTVTTFTVATNRKRKNAHNEEINETCFIQVEAWGQTGTNVQKFMIKGSPVGISGRLAQDTWQDKLSGETKQKIYIKAQEVEFLADPNKEIRLAQQKTAPPASNSAQNQASAGYQPAPAGYQPAPTGHQPAPAGYQPAPAGYQPAGGAPPVFLEGPPS